MTLFAKALSTDIDINNLKDAYPFKTLFVGQKFLYADLEKLLQLNRASNRFRTVTSRWRNMVERETGYIIDPIGDAKGFKILNDQEKLGRSQRKRNESRTKACISVRTFASIDRLKLPHEKLPEYDFEAKCAGLLQTVIQLRQLLPKPEL
jgi:hypothetical protein